MKLARFSFGFAFGTLMSRVLGFLRDATVAYFFGASHITDAFFIAFRIPNSLRRLLGEGGFNAAFVPLYTKAVEEGREREFLGKVFTFYLLLNLSFTFLGVLLSEQIVTVLAPGIRREETFSLAVFMARFLFLYLPMIGLNSLFMGVLNVKGRFFIPAFSQAVFNGIFLLFLLLFADRYGRTALIGGILIGGVFQVLINVPFLLKEKVRISPVFRLDEDIRTLLGRLLPALGGFGVNQLSLFIDTFLASFLGKGAISYLYYANRLYQLPFGIVSVGVANSLLSILSRSSANREREITDGVRLIIVLMVPAAAGLFLLSEDIVRLIYFRGSFKEEDVFYSAGALSIYSLGLVFFSLQKILSAVFFSRGDTKTPVKASLLTVLGEGILSAFFAFALSFGIFGLPAGTALSSIIGLIYLISKSEERPQIRPVAVTLLKTLISTLGMGIFIFTVNGIGSHWKVGAMIPTAALIYFFLMYAMREDLTLRLLKSLVEKPLNP